VAVWSMRATFMLPVLLNPPEPAIAGVAVLATSTMAGHTVRTNLVVV
jgi:hypothetical protein